MALTVCTSTCSNLLLLEALCEGNKASGWFLKLPSSTASLMQHRVKNLSHSCSGCRIPYSGYFSWGKIFVSSEFLASSWKNFRGRGILNHTPVLCGTVS